MTKRVHPRCGCRTRTKAGSRPSPRYTPRTPPVRWFGFRPPERLGCPAHAQCSGRRNRGRWQLPVWFPRPLRGWSSPGSAVAAGAAAGWRGAGRGEVRWMPERASRSHGLLHCPVLLLPGPPSRPGLPLPSSAGGDLQRRREEGPQ